MVQGFAWAEGNFDVSTPHELQAKGVNVYFAPEIPYNTQVVNLANGHIDHFPSGAHRPQQGYFADYASLERYCMQTGTPLVQTDGQVSTEPITTQEAGNPLQHEGH